MAEVYVILERTSNWVYIRGAFYCLFDAERQAEKIVEKKYDSCDIFRLEVGKVVHFPSLCLIKTIRQKEKKV